MKFNKMKLGKKGSSHISNEMSNFLLALLIIMLFGVVLIPIIVSFSPILQSKANAAEITATANGNTAAASLWSILGTEDIIQILMVAAMIIIIITGFVVLIRNAIKGNSQNTIK